MGSKSRRKFSKEQKAESIRLFRESSESYGTIAKELCIWETLLRNWIRQADIDEAKVRKVL
jgi:transposase-like protein